MRVAILGALLVAGSFLGAGVAAAAGYATDGGGRLYRVFPDEKTAELVGAVRVTETRDGKQVTYTPVLTDLALSDLHGLYGISFTDLYRIDLRDPARSRRVGRLGGEGTWFNALAFDPAGRLFALDRGTLFLVDLESGKAKAVGSLGDGRTSSGDLAWIGGVLFAAVHRGTTCRLVRVDPATGAAVDVGAFREAPPAPRPAPGKDGAKGEDGPGQGGAGTTPAGRLVPAVWGLIWDGRSLFGLTPAGEVLEIDRTSGIVKPLYRLSVTWYGSCPMLRV